MKVRTDFLSVRGTWRDVMNDCRSTVSKEPLSKEPSTVFKRKILIAEHSPIRNISFRWIWRSIYSFVATHWSRHKWECFIETQRSDRVGKDTSANTRHEPVNFTGIANVQHLIDTFRKRLCCQASEETRECAKDFKESLRVIQPEISDVLVPNCIYRCGCPEMEKCPRDLWASFLQYAKDIHGVDARKLSIEGRYRLYNEWFYGKRSAEDDGV